MSYTIIDKLTKLDNSKKCNKAYHDGKSQALEIYNLEGKPTIANTKPTATAAKTIEQFSLEVVCSI